MLDAGALRDCEREPLATLGLVQPRGGLLVLHARSRRVIAASAGLAGLLGLAAEPEPGSPSGGLLSPRLAEALPGLSQGAPIRLPGPAGLECLGHRQGDTFVLEWVRPSEPLSESVVAVAEAAGARLAEQLRQAAPNPFAAAQLVADGVARLSGYDRVMVYRFHPDWSGEVIAERRRPELPPYLGLRYPASDIPSQARALYRQSLIRVIADSEDLPQPLMHAGAQPPDLSFAVLRSVSPTHMEYLRNMGVRASLSVSLLHKGELWGLIACHHGRARLPPAGMRDALTGLVQPFSDLLDRMEETAEERRLHAIGGLRRAAAAGAPEDLLLSLLLRPGGLAAAAGAEGIAWLDGTRLVAVGLAPDPAALRALAAETQPVGVLERPRLDLPPSGDKQRAQPAGMLAAALPGGGWLALFRRELQQEVHWAGDPAKPAERGPRGRLSPRRSFSLWKETVRGACRPWDMEARGPLAAAVAMLRAAGPADRLAEAALEQAAAMAASGEVAAPALLVPHAPAILLEKTGEGARLLGITPALAALLGVSDRAMRGMPWEEAAALLGLAPAQPGPGGDPALHTAFSPLHGPLHMRLSLETALQVQAPGVSLHLDMLLAADETREGRLAEALKAASLQVEQSRQAREAFLGHASHELRTPLTAILGFADLLATEGAPGSEVRRQAEEIGKAGRAMLSLVETLLAVTRLDSGRIEPRQEPFDLARTLADQARLLAPLFAAKPLRLRLDLPESAPWRGDPGLVGPVLLNLLGNALKFTPPDGEVTLSLHLALRVAEIRVTDTGPGVPVSARARIFEPFEQADPAIARRHGGAGLGLFIARNMVQAMGGSLSLEPALSGGSTFVMRLPAA
ncbi:ATP-binding protein [Falsiroseomonas sp. HW251]|uniref:ATP-binding protein n=1 Tax=Falsiroseomonas sp. HW251 TaxID=3390998 RepID=UPI003D3117D2